MPCRSFIAFVPPSVGVAGNTLAEPEAFLCTGRKEVYVLSKAEQWLRTYHAMMVSKVWVMLIYLLHPMTKV
jgi:hypothetical protein